MPEFLNHNNYAVHLPGPDGRVVKVKSHQKVVLPEYFERYCARGFIRPTTVNEASMTPTKRIQSKLSKNARRPPVQKAQILENKEAKKREAARLRKVLSQARTTATARHSKIGNKLIVGRPVNTNATELLKSNLAKNNFPISNGIGVGILSFNRHRTLRRLIDSIIRYTDLRQTTVFISDDGSDDPATISYLNELANNPNFVVMRNPKRIGVAGNSNRLLRCLSRFQYGILLNDDVEILCENWERFYTVAMQQTGMHHFMYRQNGIYGANDGQEVVKSGISLKKVNERPHGAVLAFSNRMLETVGYFNESYGLYGMEHVDWSQRVWEFSLQEGGFFDVGGSDRHFVLHADPSAAHDRQALLQSARKVYSERTPTKHQPTPASIVEKVSYVIPFRNFEREQSIQTVINNIRAQRFPEIEIIMVEQDSSSKINLDIFRPVNHYLANSTPTELFNKAHAFNLGVSNATADFIILHDADMLAQVDYTKAIVKVLEQNDSCHLGKTVMYTTEDSMKQINRTGIVDDSAKCERVVGYYEGGSLACTKKAYWKVGGFNEDYYGYGCEDCDFYARLSNGSRWREDRVFNLLHLWHSRVPGWSAHHDANKQLEAQLKQIEMPRRIEMQRKQLEKLNYGNFLAEALKD